MEPTLAMTRHEAIDNDDLADILRQHRRHDLADRHLLVETGNNR